MHTYHILVNNNNSNNFFSKKKRTDFIERNQFVCSSVWRDFFDSTISDKKKRKDLEP